MKKIAIAAVTSLSLGMLAVVDGSAASAAAGDGYHRGGGFSWNGFYVGANLGAGFGGDGVVGITLSDQRFDNVGKLDSDGWFGGGQIGFNWQHGNVVFGIEADLQAADVSSEFGPNFVAGPPITGTFTGSSKVDMFGTVRARLGYSFDRALLYVTGGWAWANVDYNVTGVDLVGRNFTISSDDTFSGYVLGGGLEWAFAPSWSLKAEYQYINLGRETLTADILTAGGALTGLTASTEATPEFHTFRVGVNYKFGAREAYAEPLK
jgi:outer membrane immunogenic protein